MIAKMNLPRPDMGLPRNRAMVEGAIYALFVLVASALFSAGMNPPFWTEVASHPFKLLFVAGMLGSVFAQVSVEAFLRRNHLLEGYDISSLDTLARFSSVLLAILATLSIVWVGFTSIFHIATTCAYLSVVIFMDVFVAVNAENAAKKLPDASNSTPLLCKEICWSIFCKVDIVSIIGIVLLWAISIIFSGRRMLGMVSSHLVQASDSLRGPQAAIGKSLIQDAGQLNDLAEKMPDIFLSGAIGFHLVMTVCIINSLLRDWEACVSKLPSPTPTPEAAA